MIWTWLVVSLCAFGAPLDEGVVAFEEGRLQAAVTSWEEIPSQNRGWVVSYNLSLAKYRQGEIGEAIGLLREAKRRHPRAARVHHNLAYLRSELDAVPRPVGEVRPWLDLLTVGELGLGSGVLGLLGLVGVWRRRRDGTLGPTRPWWAAWGMGLLGLWIASQAAVLANRQPVAVVTASEVVLRDTPALDGVSRAELGLGSEVRLVQRRGDWCLIEDGRSRRGWVSKHSLFVAHAESVD